MAQLPERQVIRDQTASLHFEVVGLNRVFATMACQMVRSAS
jgi:hypothetical protein